MFSKPCRHGALSVRFDRPVFSEIDWLVLPYEAEHATGFALLAPGYAREIFDFLVG